MAVDVECADGLGIGFHPLAREGGGPFFGSPVAAHFIELFAQAAHFRDAVQADEFAEFAGGFAAQLLGGFDPAEAHEG